MADKIDDGGRAFPGAVPPRPPGMTLRQWYAGQALGNPELIRLFIEHPDGMARRCLAYADAMIAHEKAERDG